MAKSREKVSPEVMLLRQVRVAISALVRDLDEEMERYVERSQRLGDDRFKAGTRWRQSRTGLWHERLEKMLEKLNAF